MRYAPDMGERIQRGADLTRRLSEALAAEESGLIVPLGRWVLHGACRQAGIWRHDHPAAADQVMSVNVAGRQLREPGFLAEVSDALAADDLPARCLGGRGLSRDRGPGAGWTGSPA